MWFKLSQMFNSYTKCDVQRHAIPQGLPTCGSPACADPARFGSPLTYRLLRNGPEIRIRKRRSVGYLWRWGFNWKVTLHVVHPWRNQRQIYRPPQGAPCRYVSHEPSPYGKQRASTTNHPPGIAFTRVTPELARSKLGVSTARLGLPPPTPSSLACLPPSSTPKRKTALPAVRH